MRNPERIPKVMSLLTLIWDNQPDTRFHQLIHNLQFEYSNKNDDFGKDVVYKKEQYKHFTTYMELSTIDLYNLEDEAFIEFLQKKVEEIEGKSNSN